MPTDPTSRIELSLEAAVSRCETQNAPPKISKALRHAVFPGGARVRPQLALAVAMACGDDAPGLADAAAAAIELIHCASLVHDDLPMFDDAVLRRGQPTVHVAYGEPIALLTGDALIVSAFDVLARSGLHRPERLAGLVQTLATSVGVPNGICAGQAWESEQEIELSAYHQAKTGALFVAATRMGAQAAGADPEEWYALGAGIGEAFQVADDLRDALLTEEELGKPVGQDLIHNRPNAVSQLGVRGAVSKLQTILGKAVRSIPECKGKPRLTKIVEAQAARLVPKPFLEAAE